MPPRGTQVRVLGLQLLGEHADLSGGHAERRGSSSGYGSFKPRAVALAPPGPAVPGKLTAAWLSDRHDPVRVPAANGVLDWGRGTNLVDYRVVAERSATMADLWYQAGDLADAGEREHRIATTGGGVLFPRNSPAALDAQVLVETLTRRWNAIMT